MALLRCGLSAGEEPGGPVVLGQPAPPPSPTAAALPLPSTPSAAAAAPRAAVEASAAAPGAFEIARGAPVSSARRSQSATSTVNANEPAHTTAQHNTAGVKHSTTGQVQFPGCGCCSARTFSRATNKQDTAQTSPTTGAATRSVCLQQQQQVEPRLITPAPHTHSAGGQRRRP